METTDPHISPAQGAESQAEFQGDPKTTGLDVLLAKQAAQLVNSIRKFKALADQFAVVGAVTSAAEPVGTATPLGRLVTNILHAYAEFEAERK